MKKYKILPLPASPEAFEALLNTESEQGWDFISESSQGLVFAQSPYYISTNNTNSAILQEPKMGFLPDELTTGQAAKIAGCVVQTIKNHINKGNLKARIKAGKYAIRREDLEAWLKTLE